MAPYAYLKAAYPEIVAFLRGWAMFFVSETASIVAVSLVFAEYFYFIVEKIYPNVYLFENIFDTSVALLVIWFLSLINCFGVRFSGNFQNILSLIKILALLFMASVALPGALSGSVTGDSGSYLKLSWFPDEIHLAHFFALGEAMRFAFFAYSGWEGATYVAEEVKNPSKNLPRSLLWGIGTVMIIYLLVNVAYLVRLSPQEMIVSKKQVAAHYMGKSLGITGASVLAILVMLSTFGNTSAQIMVKSRTWYAMARDRLFPRMFGVLHATYKTPNQAILLQAGWATCLLCYAHFSSNAYESLIDLFSFTSAVFNILTITSVVILRKKIPLSKRPGGGGNKGNNITQKLFQAPFFKTTVSITLLIHIWFLVVTLISRPYASLMGVGLTLTGLFYYYRYYLGRRSKI